MNASDLISMSVGILYLIPLIFYIVTKNPLHLKAFIGVGGTTIISESIKYVLGKVSPRPQGAKNCNLLCNDGNQSGQPGMPSSHSATVAFFSGFYFQESNNPLIKAFLIGYAGVVMASRYVKKCHTLAQIIGGAILGVSLSFIVRHL
jgi:membrane-associated phospholipid phosphatase